MAGQEARDPYRTVRLALNLLGVVSVAAGVVLTLFPELFGVSPQMLKKDEVFGLAWWGTGGAIVLGGVVCLVLAATLFRQKGS